MTTAANLSTLEVEEAAVLERRISERRRAAKDAAAARRSADAVEVQQEQELQKQLARARKELDTARDALAKAALMNQAETFAAMQLQVRLLDVRLYKVLLDDSRPLSRLHLRHL